MDPNTTGTVLQGRSLLLARAVWLAVVGVTVLLVLLALPPRYQQLLAADVPDVDPAAYAGVRTALEVLMAAAFITTAGVIYARRSNDSMALRVGLSLVAYGVFAAPLTGALAGDPLLAGVVLVLPPLAAVFNVTTIFCFPDGRFVPAWAGRAVWIFAFTEALRIALHVLKLIPLSVEDVWVLSNNLWFAGAIAAQVYRYRRAATATQRLQMRWVILGLSAALIGYAMQALLRIVLVPLLGSGFSALNVFLLEPLFLYGFSLALPVTFAVAILRYRLYEIDALVRRSLVYTALTLGLGAVFVGVSALAQGVFARLTGEAQSPIAVSAAGVAVALLFNPARRRLKTWVDRRVFGIEPLKPQVLNVSGQTLGKYEVLEPIGKGGMAQVYRGRHVALNRTVAVKVLDAARGDEEEFRARFGLEAQTVAALQHPNIVQVYDVGVQEQTYYMAMEYVSGTTLADLLKASGRLPLADVLPIVRGVASALDYAHERGVIHRDVKPSNVMVETTPSGVRAVLMDFGIAKIVSGTTGITKTGTMGTFDYMAPEQIMAARRVDGRSDVYALGVVAYELLTGSLPFTGDNPGAVLFAHLQNPPPDARTLVPDLPAGAAAALERALAKEPDERWATAGAFAAALEG